MNAELAVAREISVSNFEIRLLNEAEVLKHEKQIKASFVGALPEEQQSIESIDALWKLYLMKKIDIWGFFGTWPDDTRKMFGCMTTMTCPAFSVLKAAHLFIYTFFKLPNVIVTDEQWKAGFANVRAWAKEQKAPAIEGLSAVPEMIRIAKAVGFDDSVHRLYLEV